MIWVEVLRVTVPGQPQPKARPRCLCVNHKPRLYKDGKTRAYENYIAQCVWGVSRAYRGKPRPLCGNSDPVRVEIKAVFKRPEYMKAKRYPDGLIPHTKKPDGDNITKVVFDSVNQLGGLVWGDDCQVSSHDTNKYYSERDGEPYLEVALFVPGGDAE